MASYARNVCRVSFVILTQKSRHGERICATISLTEPPEGINKVYSTHMGVS